MKSISGVQVCSRLRGLCGDRGDLRRDEYYSDMTSDGWRLESEEQSWLEIAGREECTALARRGALCTEGTREMLIRVGRLLL